MAAKSRHTIWFLLCLFGLGACGPTASTNHEPVESDCPLLDSLFRAIHSFKETSPQNTPTAEREAKLEAMVSAFENQGNESQDSCSYLDQNLHPDEERFDFVAPLTDWIVEDTFYQGIYYVIRLRASFNEDPAITEFFSEELAGIALHSPYCYAQYLSAHPAQEPLLLNSTRWSTTNLDALLTGFREVGAGKNILAFLEKFQTEQANTPAP